MCWSVLVLPLLCLNEPAALESTGRIHGTVINGTSGNEPLREAKVVLRGGVEGALVPIAETRTDWYGKFAFDELPLDRETIYLPGADRGGVHYPSQRVRLDGAERFAFVTITTFESVEQPSPLVSPRYEIDVNVQSELLEITETLLIKNPSRATYVGRANEDQQPVTLRLSVPPLFERITFDSEFYGRRFWIAEQQPITDIAWPPGERELKFRYRIPFASCRGVFSRQLDMPCDHVRLRVRGKDAEHASCNLPLADAGSSGERIYEAQRKQLPAGHWIELQVGRSPFPWMTLARWVSVAVLGTLGLVTVVVQRRQH